jgi:crotonobetainyl-CoA:carnitine CoA-transferase CaiB-like acyl-CoA transferase
MTSGSPFPARSGPLSGLLVADFSRILAGPYATMLLGDLGANVVKVEGPGGDDTRTWMPPEHNDEATYYLGVNRNKKGITLDLSDEDDRAIAVALSARADVLIENFKPGGLRRFGLDYDAVSTANPGIVYASISGFGTAPQANGIPGYDLMVQAISGLMSLTGSPDGPAYRAGISVFDVMAGMHATIGILAALSAREKSGAGQHVEVSLLASALSGLVNHSSAFVTGGTVPYRMGNAHPSLFPYEPLATADGDLVVIAGNDGQFRALVKALGVPELADDERFRHNQDRTARREELRPLLLAPLSTRTRDEWFTTLLAAGVPCAPIDTIDGGLAFAEKVGLGPIVTVGEGARSIPMIRHPVTLSETPPSYDLAPPSLGQDNEEIKAWLRSTTATQ